MTGERYGSRDRGLSSKRRYATVALAYRLVLQPHFALIFLRGGSGRARCQVVAEELDVLAEADLPLLDEWAAQLDALGELIGPRFSGRSRVPRRDARRLPANPTAWRAA